MKKKVTIAEPEFTSKPDKEVVVLNGQTYHAYHHHSSMENLTWGVLFIFAGFLLLCNMFGILSWNIWHIILHFWPVLIIIFGIQTIFGSGKVGRVISGILTILLFAWVLLVAIHEVMPTFMYQLPSILRRPIEWWEVISK